jgi:hypothetical protein
MRIVHIEGLKLGALERHPRRLQARCDLHQITEASPQPVQAPHHQGVARAQRLEAVIQLGALRRLAAGRFLVDHLAPSATKRVALKVKVLVIRAHTRVADPFGHTFLRRCL